MAIVNGYATLAEVKANKAIKSTDVYDDSFFEELIENTSRLIDEQTGRWFYPRIMTRAHDMPSGFELRLNADLLSITSITNGDTTSVTSSQYVTMPHEDTPFWAIRLKPSASISWTSTDDGDTEGSISIAGIWGYHTRYDMAWRSLSTLGAAISSTSATTLTAASGTSFSSGQIIKIDSEYMLVTGVNVAVITVERGWSGSTAATHLINAPITVWRTQGEINRACRDIVTNVYNNRYGNNPTGQISITGAGVIVTPDDVPATTRLVLEQIMRKGW